VPQSQWAWPWVEALARANIVQGYTATEYRPSVLVKRDAMAVFVARALVGGMNVPTGPTVGTFNDVPDYDPGPAHWAYDEVEYCASYNVVQGYTPTQYRPDVVVNRAQMAVYCYRGFVELSGGGPVYRLPVVLGGPGLTTYDCSADTHPKEVGDRGMAYLEADVDPGWAWVLFSARRLTAALDGDGSGAWEVGFDYRSASAPTVSITTRWHNTPVGQLPPAGTYFRRIQQVPWGALGGPGNYILVILVEDETGAMLEVARTAAFTMTF
jgi:hypothetical protein